jgi:hypothetical protein
LDPGLAMSQTMMAQKIMASHCLISLVTVLEVVMLLLVGHDVPQVSSSE